MSDFKYQNLQKLFRTAEVILSNQAKCELEKVNYVSDITQRDLLVLDEAKREKHDMEQHICELEAGLDDAIEINNAHAEREEMYLKRIRALKTALRMILDDPESLSGRPRTVEVVKEALEPSR